MMNNGVWTSPMSVAVFSNCTRSMAVTLALMRPLLITVPLYVGIVIAFGWMILPFLFLQAFWGWFGILTSAPTFEL